jgi:hypothetical protein
MKKLMLLILLSLISANGFAQQSKKKTQESRLSAVTERNRLPNEIPGTAEEDARRDEYFKDVKIIIDDKKRNIHIEKPYDELTLVQKRFYLGSVPEKIRPVPSTKEESTVMASEENKVFYVDDIKVTKEELLKQAQDFKHSGGYPLPMSAVNNQMVFLHYFYTEAYYDQHIVHALDYYPDKAYTVSIDNKPGDWAKKGGGRNIADIKPGELLKYPDNISFHYPGGEKVLFEYICKNVNFPAGNRKNMWMFFDVNIDGSVSDITIDGEDSNSPFTLELARVLKNAPLWMPAQQDGLPLRIQGGILLTYETAESAKTQTFTQMNSKIQHTFTKKL